MRVEPSFEFGENICFTGGYSWRLKDGELRYRGDHKFAKLINGRIPVTAGQIEQFVAAMNLLDVWRWRDDYHPNDNGMEVCDGGEWWFSANLAGREVKAGGCNAFPSYADPHQSVLYGDGEGRFGLLRVCLYEVFAIDSYIRQAEMYAKHTINATDESCNGGDADGPAGTGT